MSDSKDDPNGMAPSDVSPADPPQKSSQPRATPAPPDYRLKSVAEQIGGREVQVDKDLTLLLPEKEFHLATPELEPEKDVTCACHSVCTCVPVTTCACHAVCRCDVVAGVPARAPSGSPSRRPGASHYWRPN